MTFSRRKIYVYTIRLSPSSPARFDPCFERVFPHDAEVFVSRSLNWLAGHYVASGQHCFVLLDFVAGNGVSWASPDCTFGHRDFVVVSSQYNFLTMA